MGFLKNLLGGRKKEQGPYSSFPEVPVVAMPKSTSAKKEFAADKFLLQVKLGMLTMARPKREAQLWQGKREGDIRFLCLTKSHSPKNYQWLVDRLGGEDILATRCWESINSKKTLPGLGLNFSCLSFEFVVDEYYQLQKHLYGNEIRDLWQGGNKETQQQILFTITKPKNNKLESFVSRKLEDDCKLYPGLLNLQAEGVLKTVGPFASYRYKFPKILYCVTPAPNSESVLASSLLPRNRLSLKQGISFICQLARILSCLHEEGKIHGQICPSNVWVGDAVDDISVWLNGYSVFSSELDGGSTVIDVVHLVSKESSSLYVSPEHLSKEKLTAKTDQFLLALTCYHLLTGKHPFRASTTAAIRDKVRKCSILSASKICSDIPEDVAFVLGRMLEAKPEKRFENLREVIGTLVEIYKSLDETSETLMEEEEEFISSAAKKPVVQKIKKKEFSEKSIQKLQRDYYISCYPYPPFALSEKDFRIGRDKANDLILPGNDVSHSHAVIVHKDNKHTIKDLDSVNGIKVNGQEVKEKALEPQDEITIGSTTIVYNHQVRSKEVADNQKKRTAPIPVVPKDAKKTSTFAGDLSQISLWQILQMLAEDEKSGCLVLELEKGGTKIFFENGIVVHSESETQEGHEAFYETLYELTGRFEFKTNLTTSKYTMSNVVESLLLEGARRFDELQRGESEGENEGEAQ